MNKQERKNWWQSELVNHAPSIMVIKRKELIDRLNNERMENVEVGSNCCGAGIHLTDICMQCGEHCDAEILE